MEEKRQEEALETAVQLMELRLLAQQLHGDRYPKVVEKYKVVIVTAMKRFQVDSPITAVLMIIRDAEVESKLGFDESSVMMLSAAAMDIVNENHAKA